MRRTVCLLAALLVLPSLGSDSPKDYDDAIQFDIIEGTWMSVGATVDGAEVIIQKSVTTFRRGFMKADYGDGDPIHGRYRVDATLTPWRLGVTPASGPLRGQTVQGIFRVEGDTLKIAIDPQKENRRRPNGFDNKGLLVVTYQRVRK